jgi:hypothetical protein
MRVKALILFIAIAVLGGAGIARAEKVKTNQSTKVYSHPGEQGKVLLKLKSGQNMTVLAKEGRWLKVRVQGRTGYVPRSKVDMPDDEDIARNTRRRPFVDGRSTKRGFGGEQGPDDRIGADATGDGSDDSGGDDKGDDDDAKPAKHHKADKADKADKGDKGDKADKADKGDDDGDDDDASTKRHKGDDDDDTTVVDDDKTGDPEPDDRAIAHVTEKTKVLADRDLDSDEQFVAKPSDVLYPTDKKGKWTFVEDEEGDGGWVLTSKLDMDDGGGGPRKRQIGLRARLGFSYLSQGMRATGSTFMNTGGGTFNPDNYNLATSAVSIALGGGILFPYGKSYLFGADASLDYARTLLGGIAVPGQMGNTTIGLTDVDLRATAGYDLHKKNGLALFARLGYRYQAFLIDNVTDQTKNVDKFPSEVFTAPTLGVALAIPRLSDKVGLRFALDTVLFGASITQTKGYEDGSKPSAKAVCVGGVFTYHWKKDMDLQGTYDLNYESIDFGPPLATSMRGHTGTDTRRTDIFHTLTFGVTKDF